MYNCDDQSCLHIFLPSSNIWFITDSQSDYLPVSLIVPRPFPSSLVPLFQSESKCETISYQNDFDLHENETACRTYFHMKGFVNKLVSLPPAGIFNKFLFNLQCFFVSLRCPQLARWC